MTSLTQLTTFAALIGFCGCGGNLSIEGGTQDHLDAGDLPLQDASNSDTTDAGNSSVSDGGLRPQDAGVGSSPDAGHSLPPDAGSGSLPDAGQTTGTYHWKNVAIGGGGYVTGVLVHPAADVVYARTDVGGAYRWDESAQHWIPLLDWTTNGSWFGAASFAVHPTNGNVVALLVGRGSPMVLYSSDRGATFSQALTSSQASTNWPGDAVDGNSRDGRWGGERMAMAADGTMWVATRGQGLWKGTPTGSSWTWARETIPGVSNTANVRAIVLASDGTLWAAVHDQSVFQRSALGTWTRTGLDLSGPADVIRLVAGGTTLYATLGTYSQDATAAKGSVMKYAGGTWSAITPTNVATPPNGWGAISVLGESLVVAGNLQTYPSVMLSTNGGVDWHLVGPVSNTDRANRLSGAPGWWARFYYADHTAGLALDPRRPNRVWLTDFYGIWRTDALSDAAPNWTGQDFGHEETIAFATEGIPGGGLVTGMADVTGFTQTNLNAYPTHSDHSGTWSETIAITQAPSNSQIRYASVTKNDSNNSMVRFDGTNWIQEAGYPAREAFDVAVSASNPNLAVAVAFGGKPLRRDPSTATWSPIVSLMDDGHSQQDMYQRDRPLAADGANGSAFYLYDRGHLWVSTDGALTFTQKNTALPTVTYSSAASPPGLPGETWVALGNGLHRFTSYGDVHELLPSVSSASFIVFGAPLAGKTRPTLYLWGDAGSGSGIYLSSEMPPVWKKISNAELPMTQLRIIGASPDVPGLVFAGTSGRGIFYGQFE